MIRVVFAASLIMVAMTMAPAVGHQSDTGRGFFDERSKNNLKQYQKAKFIAKVTADHVDFDFPRRPPLVVPRHV